MHAAVLFLALTLGADKSDDKVEIPKVLDERLTIELFAAEPEIVTPTGLAVDPQGRVLVVESHTHFRPNDYVGPPADRVRMFEDTDGDGRADRITTFFEGTTWTMNIGIHPDGSVYVATRGEIFRLRDTDGDGKADERRPIARLETKGDYPHNGLSGFAFDFEGNVFFGLGENKGESFKLIGTDGSMESELEGGQIYRCRADGSDLQRVAIGFWNPFHLAFDAFGRLFAVDNDPDSLPPCRLMHIVPGGNYGYRYRNGRKGVHPFTAWNGELPGTLPMVAGTGEAPSGVLAYESDQLPADYIGDLLATSWGDHRIERFHLEPRGASFRATPTSIVTGDENFRPVGIALAPDGSLFISDWVLKSYNVHGKGRIWHLRAKQPSKAQRPTEPAAAIRAAHRPLREEGAHRLAADAKNGRPLLAQVATSDSSDRVRAVAVMGLASVGEFATLERVLRDDKSPDVRALAVRCLKPGTDVRSLAASESSLVQAEVLRRIDDRALAELLWEHVDDGDAFLAQAAREGLARSKVIEPDADWTKVDADRRLAALLVLRDSRHRRGRAALPGFLRDADSRVRFAAIQWVGEERLTEFRPGLTDALSAGPASGRLFGGYLAALERLDGVVRESHDEWAGEQYISRALLDPTTSREVRRWSLRMLRPDHPVLSIERLQQFLSGDDPTLQLEAVRSMRESPAAGRIELLSRIAADAKYSLNLRAEAVVGLSGADESTRKLLLPLAQGSEPALRDEALRSLRGAELAKSEREALLRLAQTSDADVAELVQRVIDPGAKISRPEADDLSGWLNLLDAADDKLSGDAAAGQRIFFHARSAACSRCHQMHGRGARIGPELTATAGTLSRQRLIESIVRPSREIPPQFATWLVVTTSGQSLVGMIVKEEATGEQTYADDKGDLFVVKPGEIETRRASPTSIMPDGLVKQLTVQEFRDLLAYLQANGAGL